MHQGITRKPAKIEKTHITFRGPFAELDAYRGQLGQRGLDDYDRESSVCRRSTGTIRFSH